MDTERCPSQKESTKGGAAHCSLIAGEVQTHHPPARLASVMVCGCMYRPGGVRAARFSIVEKHKLDNTIKPIISL